MSKNLISDGLYFPDWDEVQWPLPISNSDGKPGGPINIDDINTWLEYQSGLVAGTGGVNCYFKYGYVNKPAYYIQPPATGEYIVSDTGYVGVHINGSPGVEYSLISFVKVV